MENHHIFYETLAKEVIAALTKRGMEAHYVASKEDATTLALDFFKEGASISWGGSMTLTEIGLLDALKNTSSYTLLDRNNVAPEEVENIYRKAFSCDYYLMSSNAITRDGKLVNIDGTGNRVAALIYGPKEVIIIAGMNKVVQTEEEALSRIRNIASPRNAMRLNKQTPCALTGSCHDCLSPDCICMQTVITRNSRIQGRIKVILVGENLGY